MSLSSTELSFVRLLERAKRLSREDLQNNVWKVHAAATYLSSLLSKMHDEKGVHNADVMMQYGREVNQLKMLVDAEQRKTSEEKLTRLEQIPRRFPDVGVQKIDSTTESTPLLTESATGVRARNRAFYQADLRKQLMGDDKRRNAKANVEDVARQEELQEELANELLTMTRSLKQNMTIAGNVIKDDNQRLVSMSSVVDSNRERLSAEGDRLAKHAYKCGFDCMLVFVALFIFWSFICMVVMMKIFPKRVAV